MAPTDFLGESWDQVCTRLAGEQRLVRWAHSEPALAGFADLQELAQMVHTSADLDGVDEVLGALLRWSAADHGDDRDAALVVAHLMHNGARAVAISLRDLAVDIDALVAAELWAQIRTYRWRHRRRGHALGLKQDTRAALLRELCPGRSPEGARRVVLLPPDQLAERIDQRAVTEGSDVETGSMHIGSPADELLDMLIWAQASGVLTEADISLLLDFELATVAERRARAAARGVTEQTPRRHCRQVKARLQAARLAYLTQAA